MLASRILSRPSRASILQFPPSLRVAACQNTTSRQFSASRPRKAELLDLFVGPPLALLNTIHAAGIPWYATIPTAALLVRGFIAYHLSTKPAHQRAQTTALLRPILAAVGRIRRLDYISKVKQAGGKVGTRPELITWGIKEIWALDRPFVRQFYRPKVPFPSLWNFTLLLAMAEAVRMKCGAREGLLPTLLQPFQWLARQISPGNFSDPQQQAISTLAAKIEAIRNARIAQALEQGQDPNLINHSPLADFQVAKEQMMNTPLVKENNPLFDPTLTEGGLAWCPDLTVADSTGSLSIAFLAVLASGVLFSPAHPNAGTLLTFWKRYGILQRISLGFFALMAYISHAWPAAIVLYLTSSFAIGAIQRRWLSITMPIRPPIKPCARPTRVKVTKQWKDLE